MPMWQVLPKVTFKNLTNDFKAAWDGIAVRGEADIGRGNFLFGLMATILLEWACRWCKQDSSGGMLRRLSDALYDIEPRYFTKLPGIPLRQTIGRSRKGRDETFDLPPGPGSSSDPPLLWVLFDLIRNGQAHQYQQIPALLDGDYYLWISIKGAEYGRTFTADLPHRASDHLAFCEYRDGNIGIRVRADVLFSDICSAIERSGILDQGLPFMYLRRSYKITRSELVRCLRQAGHATFTE